MLSLHEDSLFQRTNSGFTEMGI